MVIFIWLSIARHRYNRRNGGEINSEKTKKTENKNSHQSLSRVKKDIFKEIVELCGAQATSHGRLATISALPRNPRRGPSSSPNCVKKETNSRKKWACVLLVSGSSTAQYSVGCSGKYWCIWCCLGSGRFTNSTVVHADSHTARWVSKISRRNSR